MGSTEYVVLSVHAKWCILRLSVLHVGHFVFFHDRSIPCLIYDQRTNHINSTWSTLWEDVQTMRLTQMCKICTQFE